MIHDYDWSVEITLRPYELSEFQKSAEIREIFDEEARIKWKYRVERSGVWDDHYLHLAIDLNGLLVGDLQLRHCEKTMPPGVLELGVDIAQEERGKGIGTQTLILASLKFLGDSFHRMSASTRADNHAMIRAFEKANWSHEGTLKSLFKSGDSFYDYESYSKTLS